ncbi:MAG: DUF2812 domain-containing protein [Carnobacterium sp.]|uniref:DUF2812 domain-containing protein n=1 Tax=Carnobacterium sp. TaxID=48221 RepID=UPI003C777412
MKKFKYFFNLDKEEKWLNEMAKQGKVLSGKDFKYTFDQVNIKEKRIKIDYRTFKSKKDLEDYILLFEDSGWQHLAGNKNSGKQYFMKKDAHADGDIFSDQLSKAERYKRMADVWLSLAAMYLPIVFIFSQANIINFKLLLNPKSLYFTPGLWELSGSSFWKAFLFETPFALGRGLAWLIFPTLIILYIVFAISAYMEYKKITSDNNLENH